MITVDIYVPYLNVSYDFSLDETASVGLVIEEIAALICLKERWPTSQAANQLELYDSAHRKALLRTSSLYESGIHSGQRLILC